MTPLFGVRELPPAGPRAERRRARRIAVRQAQAQIDSRIFPLANLSAGGFLVAPYAGDLIAHQRVYLTLLLPAGDRMRDYAIDARVVRRADGALAGRFHDLRPDARRAIARLLGPAAH